MNCKSGPHLQMESRVASCALRRRLTCGWPRLFFFFVKTLNEQFCFTKLFAFYEFPSFLFLFVINATICSTAKDPRGNDTWPRETLHTTSRHTWIYSTWWRLAFFVVVFCIRSRHSQLWPLRQHVACSYRRWLTENRPAGWLFKELGSGFLKSP